MGALRWDPALPVMHTSVNADSFFRFLYSNKELIQARREEIKELKDQIALLQQKLER